MIGSHELKLLSKGDENKWMTVIRKQGSRGKARAIIYLFSAPFSFLYRSDE